MVWADRDTGRHLHLDIEPEPDGLVENTAELIQFFRGPVERCAAPMLAVIASAVVKSSLLSARE